MKLLSIVLILILAFLTQTSSAQSWVTVNPLPTPTNINGVSFINADTGFLAVGEDNIYRTHDGGNTWKGVPTDAADYFQDMASVNNKGFVIGHNSSIGRTDDFGETWNFIKGPGYSTYWKIKFADPLHGWICGWYSTLLRTQDGGNTWQLLSQNVSGHLDYFCLDFINSDTGYIAGGHGIDSEGKLFRTFNGGVSVEAIELPGSIRVISDVEAVSYNDIWICESFQSYSTTRLYHSTDAGLTWSTVEVSSYPGSVEEIEFLTPLKGRVIGDNYCYITDDGGSSWVRKQIQSSGYSSVISTSWVNDSLAYISGHNGFIAKTENTGTTWQNLSEGSHAAFSDIAFGNSQTGCAVGSSQGNEYIYHTDDGGESWASVLDSIPTSSWIYDIAYTSETEAWACGSQDNVYHSTDGGSSWAKLHPTGDAQNSFFSFCKGTDGRIYFGGDKLIYSDNSGQTWQENDFESAGYIIRKVIFTDPMHGYLMCWETTTSQAFWGKMFRTSDGGLTWEEINYNVPGVLTKIVAADFINNDTGIISIYGSGLARTTDGGATWTYQGYNANMEIYYLKMFNDNEVVAATISGGVFYSWDGGISWDQAVLNDTPQSIHISNEKIIQKSTATTLVPGWVDGLWGTFFSEMGSGWLCRDGGLIRKYTDLYVGLDEPTAKPTDAYRIYPNPASTFIQIIGEKEPEFVSIVNSQGKCIQHYVGPIGKISVSRLPAGVYLMQITNSGRQQSLRFVKQ